VGDHVKQQLEVKVYFFDSATPQQFNAVRTWLVKDSRVKEGGVQYVSKADALKRMRKRLPELTKDLPGNPLPASYEITPARAEDVKTLAADLRAQKFKGVEKVNDGKELSDRVLKVARVIEVVVLSAVVILLVASVLLIANTIRLSIFSRRREIEVMKLVGATNWFVRGPFMLEGLLCGLAGSMFAVVLLVIGKEFALDRITQHYASNSDVQGMAFSAMALVLLAVGLGVGALGSGLTLRRFLRI
jgi:cell division transport system permease protein